MKFNAVGGVGIAVQLAALAVFRSWLKLDYLLATGLAVEIAAIHNFLWHERYTWADRPAARPVRSLVRLLKFNASNGAGSIVGNLLLMRLLVGELKLNYVVSNLVGDRGLFAGELLARRSVRFRSRGTAGHDLLLAAAETAFGSDRRDARPYSPRASVPTWPILIN